MAELQRLKERLALAEGLAAAFDGGGERGRGVGRWLAALEERQQQQQQAGQQPGN